MAKRITGKLDLEKILQKLDEGYKYTESATGRDVVLLIGPTGVGKTTLANYLSGCGLVKKKCNGKYVVETIEITDLKIGHKVAAETTYAKCIPLSGAHSNISVIDCPGFFGNRLQENSVVESLSTELAVRNAREIKGVLILISFSSLQDTKVAVLRDLIQTLISLFKNPMEMVQYSIFIITHLRNTPIHEAREETIGALNSLIHYSQEQATSLRENGSDVSSEGLTVVDYGKIAAYFSAVLQRQDDILFIDPLDNGESKRLVLDRINKIRPRVGYWGKFKDVAKKTAGLQKNQSVRPITIEDFNFDECDAHRYEFNKVLYHRADEGRRLITNICKCSDMNRYLTSDISYCQARLSKLKQLLSNQKNERLPTDGIEQITIMKSIITKNDNEINRKLNEGKNIMRTQKKLDEELMCINKEDPMIFRRSKENCFSDVSVWISFWKEMKFEACTHDENIPIIKVEKEMRNGEWVDEVDERKFGIYSITYKSDWFVDYPYASVVTYIKTKDDPGNKVRILQIDEELSTSNYEKGKLNSDIENLQYYNKGLQATVNQAENNYEEFQKNIHQKLMEYEKDERDCSSKIAELRREKELTTVAGLQYLQDFDRNQFKFEILVKIANVLKFPSAFMTGFISQYKKFVSKRKEYRFAESGDVASDSDSPMEDNEHILELKDPITGKRIKQLVVTPAGTPFDELSLLNQFPDRSKPFPFKRRDGSMEKITHLNWTRIRDIQSFLDTQQCKKIYSQDSSQIPFFDQHDTNQMDADQIKIRMKTLTEELEDIKQQQEWKETEVQKLRIRLEEMPAEVKEDLDQGVNVDGLCSEAESSCRSIQSQAAVSTSAVAVAVPVSDLELKLREEDQLRLAVAMSLENVVLSGGN